MEAGVGNAARLDVRVLVERFPFLVDEWVVTPACGHPDCQVLVVMSSLDPARNAEPVPPVLMFYTHLLQVHANRSVAPLTADAVAADALFPTEQVFTQPIGVADDTTARAVCHQVVRDVLAGILRPQPLSRDEVSTWQLAIVMAQLANRPTGPRIDPHKTEAPPEPLGGGFAINSARPWVGQDAEEARDREHG